MVSRVGTLANESKGKISKFISKYSLAVGIIVVLLMMILPLPNFIIDIFMTLNLAASIILLLVVIYVPRASNLSSFPQMVLLFTFLGLAVNVASTRLILTADVSRGTENQSAMVQAFANIVARDDIVIGFVIFIIFIIIQVFVFSKGSERVSEVSARFTLDAMSSKNFEIDNKLNQGLITPEEADLKREQLSRDIDFYSNMDGSSKFVSGNIKAGIFITVVNLVGGFLVGMLKNGLSWNEALNLYSRLTIGDGLLSQLPSLLLTFSTGILVTGDKSDEALDEKISKEFTTDGKIFIITGAVILAIAVAFHNSTALFLIPIGVVLTFYGYILIQKKSIEIAKKIEEEEKAKAQNTQAKSNPESDSVAQLDKLQLQLGYALIPLVDKEKGAELLDRITRMRKEFALEMGLPVPKVRIIDNIAIEPNVYSFLIRGIEVASATIQPGSYMCVNNGSVIEEIPGEVTKEPIYGLPAIWVPEERRSEAENAGYTIIDSATLIVTHITQIIREHASEILGRQEVELLINSVKESNPIVVNEVLNGVEGANGGIRKFSYGELQRILQGLLEEQVSIRNMVPILETLSTFGPVTNDSYLLIEKARQALGAQICLQYADNNKLLKVLNLGVDWGQELLDRAYTPMNGSDQTVAFDSESSIQWHNDLNKAAMLFQNDRMPVILCPHSIRRLVHNSTKNFLKCAVISDLEVSNAGNNIKLEILGEITKG